MNIVKITIRVKDHPDLNQDVLVPGTKLPQWLEEYVVHDLPVYEHTTITIESAGYLSDTYLLK